MTNTNLELWEKVRNVPKEHLKGFTRGGGFKGTAIKPMWSIQKMTEIFGPCGTGWGVNEPNFRIETAGSEVLVFCTVTVWYAGFEGAPNRIVYGVGGDKLVAQFSSGPKADDEAFKKAFTDAITNALKHLGVGADIHMGLWDGNKYAEGAGDKDDAPEAKKEPAEMQGSFGDRDSSKAADRPLFEAFTKSIRNMASVAALDAWYEKNAKEINNLNPDFLDDLRTEFTDKKRELKKGLAA